MPSPYNSFMPKEQDTSYLPQGAGALKTTGVGPFSPNLPKVDNEPSIEEMKAKGGTQVYIPQGAPRPAYMPQQGSLSGDLKSMFGLAPTQVPQQAALQPEASAPAAPQAQAAMPANAPAFLPKIPGMIPGTNIPLNESNIAKYGAAYGLKTGGSQEQRQKALASLERKVDFQNQQSEIARRDKQFLDSKERQAVAKAAAPVEAAKVAAGSREKIAGQREQGLNKRLDESLKVKKYGIEEQTKVKDRAINATMHISDEKTQADMAMKIADIDFKKEDSYNKAQNDMAREAFKAEQEGNADKAKEIQQTRQNIFKERADAILAEAKTAGTPEASAEATRLIGVAANDLLKASKEGGAATAKAPQVANVSAKKEAILKDIEWAKQPQNSIANIDKLEASQKITKEQAASMRKAHIRAKIHAKYDNKSEEEEYKAAFGIE